ncbi:MAG: LamG-like jellyroll fold domain-containing protein [Actinomycetota bacterium]
MCSRSLRLTTLLSAIVLATLLPAVSASAATTVALWHMNESSGPMVDSSSFGNDGTLSNVTRVSGSFNGSKAYSFNGSSSKVTVSNDASLNPGSQNVTITVHVKFSQVPSASIIDYDLVRKQSGAGTYKVEILRTGKAFCKFRGTSRNVAITAGPNLADNAWHTIVCTKTSSSVRLTVDGTSFVKNGSVGSITNAKAVFLGSKGGADWYKGLMDEVSIVFG